MKSKFQPIIKLKEQTIEEISAKIAEINQQIEKQIERIALHKTEYFKNHEPESGSMHYFAQKQLLHVAFKQELNSLEHELNYLYGQERQLQQQLSDERLELERYNVLHQEIVQKAMEKAKKQESDFLDEIGSTAFANRGLF